MSHPEEIKQIGRYIHIKSEDEYNKFISDNESAMILFHAIWNGPSVIIGDYWRETVTTHPEAKHCQFAMIDVDELDPLCEKLEINEIPQFCIYKKGKTVDTFSGGDKNRILDLAKRTKI